MELTTSHGMSSPNRPLTPSSRANDDPQVFSRNARTSWGARRSSKVCGVPKSAFLRLRIKWMIQPVRTSVAEVRRQMKRRKPVYVLGTGLAHDGSACLRKDGE